MDLITDYKKIYVDSCKKTKDYLKSLYIDIDEKNKNDAYLAIDKYYRAISIWNRVLDLEERDEKLVNNILLDYCFLLHGFVIFDIKGIKFLFRNIIESFIRFITNDYEGRDIELIFSNITKKYEGKEKVYLGTYISQLKQIYDEACLYIHANTDKMNEEIYTLLSIQTNNAGNEIKKTIEEFTRMNVAMLCIIKKENCETYDKMKENAQGYLNYIIPLEERIREKKLKD